MAVCQWSSVVVMKGHNKPSQNYFGKRGSAFRESSRRSHTPEDEASSELNIPASVPFPNLSPFCDATAVVILLFCFVHSRVHLRSDTFQLLCRVGEISYEATLSLSLLRNPAVCLFPPIHFDQPAEALPCHTEAMVAIWKRARVLVLESRQVRCCR